MWSLADDIHMRSARDRAADAAIHPFNVLNNFR